MGKKTTITLDSELRNKLYIMKKKCNMNSMEEIIDVLFEATDEVKIKDYVKNCTDISVNILIYVSRTDMKKILENPYKFLNLETYIHMKNMYAFDENYILKKFEQPYDLIDYFYDIRLKYYDNRKKYLIKKINLDKSILYNRIKFINGVISNKIKIHRQTKVNIVNQLDTLKMTMVDDSYDYLLGMPIYSLTKEKIDELKEQYEKKKIELEEIKKTEITKMWLKDLRNLKKTL